MSNSYSDQWSKTTQTSVTESETALQNKSLAEQEEELKKIKKQWQKKQHHQFKKIQHSQLQKKSSKSVITLLISIAALALSTPILWKITQNTFVNNSSHINSDVANDNNQNNDTTSESESPSILDKLKALEKRSKTGDFESDCVETPAATVCKSDSGKSVKKSNGDGKAPTIEDQVDQSIEQINEYNRRLQEAIDGS